MSEEEEQRNYLENIISDNETEKQDLRFEIKTLQKQNATLLKEIKASIAYDQSCGVDTMCPHEPENQRYEGMKCALKKIKDEVE